MDTSWYLFVSMAMFMIGMCGVLTKRNPLVFFLSIELMMNAANFLFILFSKMHGNHIGQMWVFFVIVVAAAEAAIGLAIVIHLFRKRHVIDLDEYNHLQG